MKLHSFNTYTFGCRVNEAETLQINKNLEVAGFIHTSINPSYYIINSCAVTMKAEREVRQHIYQIKKKFPSTKIIVTGCAATQWILNNISVKDVDLLVHNEEKYNILSFLTPNKITSNVLSQESKIITHDIYLSSGRLMVKLQEGCSRYCTYCIVPYLRGKPKTFTIHSIIDSIDSFGPNIKEVILSAINTEYFGCDTGETLQGLIESIWKHTESIRVGFGSIHPWSLTDDFLSWYEKNASSERFIHYFHIPIQSGCNTTLKRMNRKYEINSIIKIMNRIKKANPYAQIGTDIIVGFPGETGKEFLDTYQLLEQSPIDRYHVFRYSPRPGTAAFIAGKRWGEVSPKEKEVRSKKIRDLGEKKYSQFLRSNINRINIVVILQKKVELATQALGDNYIPIRILNSTYDSGLLKKVKIIRAHRNYCIGKMIS
jgi:threonylcarbamoyladenosine tRNA methylthiotransferase MtaB